VVTAESKYRATTPEAAKRVMIHMANEGRWNQRSTGGDTPFKFIADFNNRASGKAAIRELREFHSTSATQRVEEQICDDMQAGRLAIVPTGLATLRRRSRRTQ
jgi:hypothetical protein